MCRALWAHRLLVRHLVQRELEGRYRGMSLGRLWSFLQPLLMLALYTLVFGLILRLQWPESRTHSLTEFALALYCGLAAFSILSECATRAPTLIVQNPSYVKKVVFPIETLPLSATLAALVHGGINLIVVAAVAGPVMGGFHAVSLLAPLLLVPLVLICLGATWLLAALGVFFRDLQEIVAVAVTALFFLTPIFYSPLAVPAGLRPILALNPLAFVVAGLRDTLLWGRLPSVGAWAAWTVLAAGFSMAGYAAFMRLKDGFADVV
jgi:lipopolysaccharide transport system permease protein